MSQAGPLYKNQQLRSVSLETHFRGRASALGRLELVQAAFDRRFPALFVPNAVVGSAISLQPYQLRSNENGLRGEAVAVAVNQATYVSFDYPGFDAFLVAALTVLPKTYEIIGVTELTRVGIRYDNLIAIERGSDGVVPLEKILRPALSNAIGAASGTTNLKVEWSGKWDKGNVEISAAIDDVGGVDALRLMISATVNPAGSVEQLSTLAELAHVHGRDRFESLITDEFRSVLRGIDGV